MGAIGDMSVIILKPLGRLGNQMCELFFARILAQKLNYQLHGPNQDHPHFVLHNIDLGYNNSNHKNYESPIQYIGNEQNTDYDISNIINDPTPRKIILNDYFQRKKYYIPYREEIKKWCNITPFNINQNDIGIHIRLGDLTPKYHIEENKSLLPIDYYIQAIETIKDFEYINICTDSPEHEYISILNNKYKCRIIQLSPKMTIDMLSQHDKLILSQGSFSFWAGFLSSAKIIINVLPKTGWNSLENGKVDFLMDTPNYKNIIL